MSHLRKLFKGKTPTEIREASGKIIGLMKSKDASKKIHMTKDRQDLSIQDVAEATLGESGMEALRYANEDSCFRSLEEAVDPVNLTAFSNITGNMVFQGVVEQYRAPELIGDQLVTNETSREDNTRVPGITPISDSVLEVKEGTEFPDVKYGEDYIDIPQSKKRGAKIGITREMIFFDRTGLVMEMARAVGERMGTDREKRILDVVLGIDDTFSRKGTARNTYVASADPRINQLSGIDLQDWTQLDTAWQLFNAMTDDRATAEPIQVTPDTLLVTQFKYATAQRILHATMNRNTQGANAQYGDNPISYMGGLNQLKVLTSPWIQARLVTSGQTATQAKYNWFIGQPKKAFVYRTLFPLQTIAAHHDKDSFERDVVAQFRTDERGVAYIKAPWYMCQLYNT